MTVYEKTARTVFSVPRQLASTAVRVAALASLRPGDVVQAVDVETHEVRGTRRLTTVDNLPWACRYVVTGEPDWSFDAEGRQLDAWMEPRPGGLLLIRPWLSPGEADHLLWESARPIARPLFSWALYGKHMETTYKAVMSGDEDMPEAPWRED